MPSGKAVLSGVVGKVAEDTQSFGGTIYSGSSALYCSPYSRGRPTPALT